MRFDSLMVLYGSRLVHTPGVDGSSPTLGRCSPRTFYRSPNTGVHDLALGSVRGLKVLFTLTIRPGDGIREKVRHTLLSTYTLR